MSAGSSLRHGQPGEHPRHRLGRVGAEVGVGHAGLLEVEDVEEALAERRAHERHRRHRPAGEERHAHRHHPGHPVGVEQRHLADDHRAPVVADEDRLLGADVVEQAEQVVGEVVDVVVLDRPRAGRTRRSRAGRGRARGSRRRRARGSGGATSTTARGSRGRAPRAGRPRDRPPPGGARCRWSRPDAHGSTGGWWACGLPGRVRTAMTLPPRPDRGANPRATRPMAIGPATRGVTLRRCTGRRTSTPRIAWRAELGRLAALVGAAGPRHRPAGARRLREEPGDLRLPRRRRRRPRAVRARDRRSSRRWCCGRSGLVVGLVRAAVAHARPRRVDGGARRAGRGAAPVGVPPARWRWSSRPRWRPGRLGAHRAGQGLPDVEPAARRASPVMALVAFLVRCRRRATCVIEPRTSTRSPPSGGAALGRARSCSTSCRRRRSSTRPARSTRRGSRTWPGWPARATWYRNHTTHVRASPTTRCRRSSRARRRTEGVEPLFTEHPDNLFRLLAGSHDLVVSEALTRLCPTVGVRLSHRPRPRPGDDDGRRPTTAARRADGRAVPRRRRPVVGAGHRCASDDPTADFGEFEEEVEAVPDSRSDVFGSRRGRRRAGRRWHDRRGGRAGAAGASSSRRLQPAGPAGGRGDPPRVTALPVAPPPRRPHLRRSGGGGRPPDQRRQRRRAVDPGPGAAAPPAAGELHGSLVGQILDQLEAVDLYDDAAVVVTADHGVAFHGRREPSTADPRGAAGDHVDAADREGAGADRSHGSTTRTCRRIDIVPTIADLIGVDIPWEVDGLAAGSEAQLARDGTRSCSAGSPTTPIPNPSQHVEVDGAAGLRRDARAGLPADRPRRRSRSRALYGLSGHGELVGQPFEPTGEISRRHVRASTTSTGYARQVRAASWSSPAPSRAGGWTTTPWSRWRTIGSSRSSPVVFRNIGGSAFALLLPLDRQRRRSDRGPPGPACATAELLDGGPLSG